MQKQSIFRYFMLISLSFMLISCLKAEEPENLLYKGVINSVNEWNVKGKATSELKKYENSSENGIAIHYTLQDQKNKYVRITKNIPKVILPEKFDIIVNLESLNDAANLEMNIQASNGSNYKARLWLGARKKQLTTTVLHSSEFKHVGPRKEQHIRPKDIVSISFSLTPVDTRITPTFKPVSGTLIISGIKIMG